MTEETNRPTDDDLLLAFYGDDFTGSTDALEGLAANGVRAVLFLDPPTRADLDRFDDLDALGIAGASRSMTPGEMTEELRPAFEALSAFDVPIVHYKVCSTFDSAPDVGSIGRAIDIGQEMFDSPVVPVSQGTEVPHGRYVAFSNLFAVQDGETYRIDRHPTMRDHPVTPMREGDLRRHLGEQTERDVGHVHVTDLEPAVAADSALSDASAASEIVVLDALHTDHLETIGRLLWDRAIAISDPLFVVGSSGLEHHALVHTWAEHGRIDREERLYRKRESVDELLVVAGSASGMTAAQIDWASENGFRDIRLDTEALVDPNAAATARESAVEVATDALVAGDSVVLYSARGSDDPALKATRRRFRSLGIGGALETRLGREQGEILREVLERTRLRRACVAGGDTSSHAIPRLGIRALEAIAPVGPGAPLCRAHADDPAFDGLEIALKGGQIGTRHEAADYFGVVREGGVAGE
ncbi:four-carbon acid sugar kinase family protein [Halomarina halobia]|uniref:Four-carbon acid sugar kinase family protein n=2 Tax=Halomarina halobia TaxID=3033386 RepID=A0ABD6AFD4_9EURY|nr:four-carbon acid sugar kinase family protein [Halomarina sp. PSR21]